MSTQQLSFATLDVFTSTKYTGNPLAIVNVPQSTVLSQDQKQRIAREFNLSETVFLHQQTEQDLKDDSVRIDIFTAYAEIPFAGHPTVGTANYLLQFPNHSSSRHVKALQAKAGRIGVILNSAIDGVQISVAHHVHVHNSPFADKPFGKYPVVSIVEGMTFILALLPDLETLGQQWQNLLGAENTYTSQDALDEGWRVGMVPTYFYVDTGTTTDISGATVRTLRTRNFGSREDPATGSAASALTSYLSLMKRKAGTYKYQLTQGVEMGQRSEIFVEVSVKDRQGGDEVEIEQVLLSGCAVLVMQGTLDVPPP
ncbi:uncharacterized protein Z518_03173 [Rhinocladiella mackenziei CBS 650.93]|uniref:Phenazine biosynthesis protein n=1 Tax=Rhinocladiella mackenziei CBS 650.93 TaxID=1442369 RepID=A0A0D2G228_9EURO|nr:uncharacterized protein Z518_03173 [Rhinocladiella mackenziei CBS 650.93]KIX08517.1 hypothetical protein Z518_03173 [Rhinocladiella mackenziei CBS 650.93]